MGTKFHNWNHAYEALGNLMTVYGSEMGGWMPLLLSMAPSGEELLEAPLLLLISGVQCIMTVGYVSHRQGGLGFFKVVHLFIVGQMEFCGL